MFRNLQYLNKEIKNKEKGPKAESVCKQFQNQKVWKQVKDEKLKGY